MKMCPGSLKPSSAGLLLRPFPGLKGVNNVCLARRISLRSRMGDVENNPSVYITPDGMFTQGCSYAPIGPCQDPECEGLHMDMEDYQEQQRFDWPADEKRRLVICAGPERSGSTWLFNAVRLLFRHAKCPLDSYWIHHITDEKLRARGVGKRNILVKTHHWSDGWDTQLATDVVLTHRNLKAVLASYERMGWMFGSLPRSYVAEHLQWKGICNLDIACEDLYEDGEGQLASLADRLGTRSKVDIKEVNEELRSVLSSGPNRGSADPITKLWPGHLRPSVAKAMQGVDVKIEEYSEQCGRGAVGTGKQFEEYNRIYGYS